MLMCDNYNRSRLTDRFVSNYQFYFVELFKFWKLVGNEFIFGLS